ncbi:MAG TPA: hypothetical protein VF553_22035 [Pyrinomonadaceae bacterium]|jgi:YbbR domain-containing protein
METTTIFAIAIPAMILAVALFVIYSRRQHQKNTAATSIKSHEPPSKRQAA